MSVNVSPFFDLYYLGRERQSRITAAATRWAKAERALRNQQDLRERGGVCLPEDDRRIGLEADYSEQLLLDIVEGREPLGGGW